MNKCVFSNPLIISHAYPTSSTGVTWAGFTNRGGGDIHRFWFEKGWQNWRSTAIFCLCCVTMFFETSFPTLHNGPPFQFHNHILKSIFFAETYHPSRVPCCCFVVCRGKGVVCGWVCMCGGEWQKVLSWIIKCLVEGNRLLSSQYLGLGHEIFELMRCSSRYWLCQSVGHRPKYHMFQFRKKRKKEMVQGKLFSGLNCLCFWSLFESSIVFDLIGATV